MEKKYIAPTIKSRSISGIQILDASVTNKITTSGSDGTSTAGSDIGTIVHQSGDADSKQNSFGEWEDDEVVEK